MGLAEARIRLEGQLEVLEEAASALEQACAQLDAGRVGGVATALKLRDAPETLHARVAVEELVESEPDLAEVLERFTVARRGFVEKLQERAHELGLEGEAPSAIVHSMTNDPVLYQSRGVSPVVLGVILGVAGFVMVATWGQRGPPLLAGIVMGVVVLSFFGSNRLVVTSKRVVIGPQVVSLDGVQSIHIHRFEYRGQKGGRRVHYEVTFERGGEGYEPMVRLERMPEGFRSALCRTGVAVRFSETTPAFSDTGPI